MADRRIERTRRALQQALLALIEEKAYDQIEIGEIVNRANTARVTFYRHYRTREDLLIDCIDSIYHDMMDFGGIPVPQDVMDFSQPPPNLRLFVYVDYNTLLCQRLFNSSASMLLQKRIREYVVNEVTLSLLQQPAFSKAPIELIAQHIASSTIGNMIWWLNAGKPLPAAEIARLTHQMSIVGVLTIAETSDAASFVGQTVADTDLHRTASRQPTGK
jgi:AcrR family transcriptional regulator